MEDRIDRPALSLSGARYQGAPDPSSRIEPLGVPLARFGAILSRQWWVVLTTIAVIAGGTACIVMLMPKQYTAEAAILIEPRRTQVSDLQAISADPGDVASLIRTQIDILHSQGLLAGVVTALQLDTNPDFVNPDNGVMSKITARIHRALSIISKGAGFDEQQKIQLAAGLLSGKISFSNELKSSRTYSLQGRDSLADVA